MVAIKEKSKKCHDQVSKDKSDDVPLKCHSVSQAIDDIGYGKFHFLLTLVVGIANLSDTIEMMILVLIEPILKCTWQVSTKELAFLITTVCLAMSISSPLWGFVTDNYGRRNALIGSSSLLFIFGLASAFSPSFMWLFVFRFFCGSFIACMPQCITLLMEYLPTSTRGRANVYVALIITLGSCATVLIGRLTMDIEEEYRWRLIVALGTTPLLIFLICAYWVPESILYLVGTQRTMEAEETLRYIHRTNNGKKAVYDVNVSFCNVEKNTELKKDHSNLNRIFVKLFDDAALLLRKERRSSTILIWIQWFLLGTMYYGVMLLSVELVKVWDAGCIVSNRDDFTPPSNFSFSKCMPFSSDDYFSLLWTSLAEFPGGLIALFIMDIIGRKKTFVLSGAIYTTSLCLLLSGCTLSTTLLVVLLFIARGACSAYSWCVNIYTREVHPTQIRAIGVGTASTFARIGGVVAP